MKKRENLHIAYIGGGSRGWAWKLMCDLALEEQLSGTIRLFDLNEKAARDNAIIGNNLSNRDDVRGKWFYETKASLEEALEGADFVVISILPGTFNEMAADVHLPEEYEIYQPVGDTTGPGGLMRALRAIPMYVEIAEAIKERAPTAWVINYTNPMALCLRALYHTFPGIKAFGCCHEVFGTQDLLVRMLEEMKGFDGINRAEIKVNVLGINHFTWFDRASYHDMDLFPWYEHFVEKFYTEGYERKKGDWEETVFSTAHRVKFDLFKKFGLIAAAGDRHLAEFTPSKYLKNPETVKEWRFHLTPIQWRIKDMEEKEERRVRLLAGEERIELTPSQEEGVRQIKALLGLGDLITNVNLPNQGQLKGLPEGSVVETNALFSRDSVQPVLAGELPWDLQTIALRELINQEAILRAAVNRDRKMAFRAFINNPLISLDESLAMKLFSEMLAKTREYLPGWED